MIPSTPLFQFAARRTIALCLLIQLGLTWNLWTSVNRAFPFVPFLTFWPSAFDLFTFPVFVLLLLGLLILLIRPDKSIGLWCFGFSLLFCYCKILLVYKFGYII